MTDRMKKSLDEVDPDHHLSKFTEGKREAYLELLRKGNRRYASARAVGVSPRLVRMRAQHDPEFKQAILDAEAEATEVIEDALYETAKKGNVTAQLVILYNRQGDRWQDKRRPDKIELTGSVKHELEAGPALERIAALQERLDERAKVVDAKIVEDPKELEEGQDGRENPED